MANTPSFETLSLDITDRIATVTLNRPKALNALNADMVRELGEALDAITAPRADVGVMILTGAGKAFVAGADIAQMADFGEDEAWAFALRGQRMMARLEALPFPVIAAVNGFALGGGCELAMACDMIYASSKAKFGQPEVNLGVIPGFGGTQRLQRLVGPQVARDLIFTGRIIRADEALRIGLAARVIEPEALMEEVRATATTILSKGPLAIAAAKRVIRRGAALDLDQANNLEAAAFGRCFATEDQREGMSAFLEKRAAEFKGA